MKNYKIIRIAGVHSQGAITSLYLKNPQLKSSSYVEQQKALFANSFMYSDTFSREMKNLGNEAEEIVYDVETLQRSWMKERNIPIRSSKWQHEIILSQLAEMKPDVVFFQDIHSLPYELRLSLKEKIPSIKKLVIFRGYPGIDHKLFKELSLADLLLVGSPILLEKGKEAGLNPHLVYHSFDPLVLEKLKLKSSNETIDFSFIGSSGYGYGAGHQDRYWMLFSLLQQTEIALWIDEPEQGGSYKERFRSQIVGLIKSGLNCCSLQTLEKLEAVRTPHKIKKLIVDEIECKKAGHIQPPSSLIPRKPLHKIFPNRCHSPLFGLDMFQKLQQSKIVLNKHSNPAEGTVDNIRLFQATGVGTCLLTDTGKNMGDLFEEDREVVTYSSTEECIEKAKYLLENEGIRKQIAEAGQKRTLKDHSAANRYRLIHGLLQKIL